MRGHLGRDKTEACLLERFFWHGVYKEVGRYCKTSPICQVSTTNKPPLAPLVLMPIVKKPFEQITLDITDPFPNSSAGNQYVLVMMD